MRKVEKRRTFFLFDFLCILPLLCGLFFKLPYIRVFLKKFDGILFFFLTSLTGIRGKRSFGLGNVYWTFNLQTVFCIFETMKMFYPPEGVCLQLLRGPIVFNLCFIVVREGCLMFQNPLT